MAKPTSHRTLQLAIRLTPTEKRTIELAAKRDNRTAADWMRLLILREATGKERASA